MEAIDEQIYTRLMQAMGSTGSGELLVQLEKDLSDSEKKLRAAVPALDLAVIRAQSHILVSVAGAIGGRNVQEISQKLNELAKVGKPEAITALGETCLAELSTLLEFVRNKQIRVE